MVQYFDQHYPFQYVTLDRILRGRTTAFWSVDSDFDEASPWTFDLQFAEAGEDEWTTVDSVDDEYSLVDTTRREYGAISESFYRVKLTSTDGGIYYSLPTNIPQNWTLRDLRIAEEIKRKEEILYSDRYSGLTFWILIRRNWGTVCDDCTDPISGEIKTSQCLSCFGTGIEGGYFRPYETTGMIIGEANAIEQTGLGTGFTSQMVIRYCPLPTVMERDVIILSGFGTRFYVDRVETVAHIKGLPIIQHVTIKAAPVSDIIHDLNWRPTGVGSGYYGPTGATGSDFE